MKRRGSVWTHCLVFGLGCGVAVLTVDGVKDGLLATRVEFAVLLCKIQMDSLCSASEISAIE